MLAFISKQIFLVLNVYRRHQYTKVCNRLRWIKRNNYNSATTIIRHKNDTITGTQKIANIFADAFTSNSSDT